MKGANSIDPETSSFQSEVPKGRPMQLIMRLCSAVPSGLISLGVTIPTLKRWAILMCPFGTGIRTAMCMPLASTLLSLVFALNALAQTPLQTNYVRGQMTELNDNGAWSWFMDPRAIIDHGRLIAGSVRAIGGFGDSSPPDWGNVELSILNLKNGKLDHVVLHQHLEQDDHDSPGLLVLKDGRYFAAYSKHNMEPRMWFRISSRPGDPYDWQPEVEVTTPALATGPRPRNNFTYCNPIMLSGRKDPIYLFHRGVSLNPNYLVSHDDGRSWSYGGMLFDGLHGYSPYAKYAWDGKKIHFVCTDDHPRNHDNSLYHGVIRNGQIYKSNDSLAGPLSTTTHTDLHPWDLTRLYEGGPNHRAWMCDIKLDRNGNPVVLFTVHMDGAGLPQGQGGMDHRFHYAKWDGAVWRESEIAYAGKRLYAGEDDYTGLGAIDPRDPSVIFISTDADIHTGAPLIGSADGERHHELFRGKTTDGGKTWRWTPITANSTMDNLRPIIAKWKDTRTVLIWMRGAYRANRGEWTTKVVVSILKPADFAAP